MTALRQKADETGERCFTRKQLEETIARLGIRTADTDSLIDGLNSVGDLLKRGSMFKV